MDQSHGVATVCGCNPATPYGPPHTATKARRREWPDELHWQGIGMRRMDHSFPQIPGLVGIPSSTPPHVWSQYLNTGGRKAKPPGRPCKTRQQTEKHHVIASKRQREISYWRLHQVFANTMSIRTMKHNCIYSILMCTALNISYVLSSTKRFF